MTLFSLLWIGVELVVLAAAVWLGAQIAQIEYADFGRCFTVAVFALIFGFVAKLIFVLLAALTVSTFVYSLG